MQRKHTRGAELAPRALVGLGRIGVAIAQHDGTAIERGTDDLRDGLRAVGKHQPKFGARIDWVAARIEQQAADAIAEARAAGLARGDDIFAAPDEPFVQFA